MADKDLGDRIMLGKIKLGFENRPLSKQMVHRGLIDDILYLANMRRP